MKPRHESVLEYVVQDYVHTTVPVGSHRIAERLDLSSATIRNIMQELEREGYLEQPHTSAGRMPTDRGYRYFVDYLMKEYCLVEEQAMAVQMAIDSLRYEIEELLRRVARLLAEWAGCIAFAAMPEETLCRIEKVEITKISASGALIILLLSNGVVENKFVHLPMAFDDTRLARLSRIINTRLSGLQVGDADQRLLDEVFSDIREMEAGFSSAIRYMLMKLMFSIRSRVIYEGEAKILRQPEFRDANKASSILELLDSGHDPAAAMLAPSRHAGAQVTIGSENRIEELHDCSIICSSFRLADNTTGAIGLLGPRRMEYSGHIGITNFIAGMLTRVFFREGLS